MSNVLLIVMVLLGTFVGAFGIAEYLAQRNRSRPGLPWAGNEPQPPTLIECLRQDRN